MSNNHGSSIPQNSNQGSGKKHERRKTQAQLNKEIADLKTQRNQDDKNLQMLKVEL